MNAASANPEPNLAIPGIRATRAIVDLDAIAGNLRALAGLLPAPTRLMAVVKADGYGHGAPWVARAALEAGATSLGVATVSEGEVLRRHGIGAPIVLLGSIDPSEVGAAVDAGLEITIGEPVLLDAVRQAARLAQETPIAVHLKIDSGLRRYGATPDNAVALASGIASAANVRFAGISTHFASADEPSEPFTEQQLRQFEDVLAAIRNVGIALPPVHAANSAGILTGQGVQYDMVRVGIALYGVQPSAEVPLPPHMCPALRLESRIARIVPIHEGDTIGYNRTFRAPSAMIAALVPIGYADGYRRALSDKGWVGMRGRRCRVLGRVSMDQIVVDVSGVQRAAVGDTVHVMGGGAGRHAPEVDEVADLCGTNSYEILVGVGQRVPRVYIEGGKVVGVRVAGADVPTPDAGERGR